MLKLSFSIITLAEAVTVMIVLSWLLSDFYRSTPNIEKLL